MLCLVAVCSAALNVLENCSRKILGGISGESKNWPGGGGTVVFSGRCAEAHEDPRKEVDPVRRGAAGPECILQAAVEAFHHPVGLRMVGGGLVVLDVEEAAESGPQGGGELGPASSLGRYVFGSEISYNKAPPPCLG